MGEGVGIEMGATGKVYLVCAGPGHPELLTIKAANLIKAADVIIYDRLVQEDVLALAKPTAERIYMGKPVGRHDSRQDEVNELLVHKAREGKTVVRLRRLSAQAFRLRIVILRLRWRSSPAISAAATAMKLISTP
jgi:precorrin-6B methylase 1